MARSEPTRPQARPAAVLALLLLGAGCAPAPPAAVDGPPSRIVSMAPALTETVFALGLGDRLVGVTRYCDYPEAATRLPEVGGYLDPDWEALVALEPDLVLLMQDHREIRRRLEELGLATLLVDQGDVEGILASFVAIGEACGAAGRGRELAGRVRARLDEVAAATASRPRPRALVVVERELAGGPVRTVWVAGPGTFYDDLLGLAGAVNAWRGPAAALYPEVSREGLIALDPDVILDLVTELERRGLEPAQVRADWQGLGELRAVRAGRVHVLDAGFMVIPGPRIADAVAAIAAAVHPDLRP